MNQTRYRFERFDLLSHLHLDLTQRLIFQKSSPYLVFDSTVLCQMYHQTRTIALLIRRTMSFPLCHFIHERESISLLFSSILPSSFRPLADCPCSSLPRILTRLLTSFYLIPLVSYSEITFLSNPKSSSLSITPPYLLSDRLSTQSLVPTSLVSLVKGRLSVLVLEEPVVVWMGDWRCYDFSFERTDEGRIR